MHCIFQNPVLVISCRFEFGLRHHKNCKNLLIVLFYVIIQSDEGNFIQKGTLNSLGWVLPNNVVPPKLCLQLGGFFYIKTTNSSDNRRKIISIKEKIKKSFLNILSPPFFYKKFGSTQLIKCSQSQSSIYSFEKQANKH